ncbi:hypothetical protein J6590_021657 [Homalodisca vitripennis]|nr:hypothetical protein J6590_021657 [Homalodisca vitripennis]
MLLGSKRVSYEILERKNQNACQLGGTPVTLMGDGDSDVWGGGGYTDNWPISGPVPHISGRSSRRGSHNNFIGRAARSFLTDTELELGNVLKVCILLLTKPHMSLRKGEKRSRDPRLMGDVSRGLGLVTLRRWWWGWGVVVITDNIGPNSLISPYVAVTAHRPPPPPPHQQLPLVYITALCRASRLNTGHTFMVLYCNDIISSIGVDMCHRVSCGNSSAPASRKSSIRHVTSVRVTSLRAVTGSSCGNSSAAASHVSRQSSSRDISSCDVTPCIVNLRHVTSVRVTSLRAVTGSSCGNSSAPASHVSRQSSSRDISSCDVTRHE